MVVIAHQDIRVQDNIVLLQAPTQLIQKAQPVIVRKEYL